MRFDESPLRLRSETLNATDSIFWGLKLQSPHVSSFRVQRPLVSADCTTPGVHQQGCFASPIGGRRWPWTS